MRCKHCDTPDMMRECHWPKPPCTRRRHVLESIERANSWVETWVITTILIVLAGMIGLYFFATRWL